MSTASRRVSMWLLESVEKACVFLFWCSRFGGTCKPEVLKLRRNFSSL